MLKLSYQILGSARISNVEFRNAGQYGWNEADDPRFSLAFLKTGAAGEENPSYIKKSTFNMNFSPALGIFGGENIVVEDNVFYHGVGSSKFILYPQSRLPIQPWTGLLRANSSLNQRFVKFQLRLSVFWFHTTEIE